MNTKSIKQSVMSGDLQQYVRRAEDCMGHNSSNISGPFCNATWDTITCWPPTPPGFIVRQLCPPIFGAIDAYVYKSCQSDGQWATPELWKGFGYSDYTECVKHLSVIEEVFELKKEIQQPSMESGELGLNLPRIVAMISLLSVSIVSLIVVNVILRCMLPKGFSYSTGYKITRNICFGVGLEAVLYLIEKSVILYDANFGTQWLLGTPILCKVIIILVEYANTTIVIWFLIQCHFLHLTSKSGRLGLSAYCIYSLIGWLGPLVPTLTWVVVTLFIHRDLCWAGYKSQPIVWIIEIPKLIMIVTALAYIIMSFQKLSKNQLQLVKRCSFHRLYLQSIGVTIVFVYLCGTFFLDIAVKSTGQYQ